MSLLCFVAIGAYGFMGPFWALPSEFLTGLSAAAGLALINSVGNLAGFVGPYAIGAISKTTESLCAGLAFAGVFMFAAAILVLRLPDSGLAGLRDHALARSGSGVVVLNAFTSA